MLSSLSRADVAVRMEWATPEGTEQRWVADRDSVLALHQSLATVSPAKHDRVSIPGEVVTLSLRGKFEIRDDAGTMHSGGVPAEMLETIKQLHVGQRVQALIQRESMKDRATGRTKVSLILLEISPA